MQKYTKYWTDKALLCYALLIAFLGPRHGLRVPQVTVVGGWVAPHLSHSKIWRLRSQIWMSMRGGFNSFKLRFCLEFFLNGLEWLRILTFSSNSVLTLVWGQPSSTLCPGKWHRTKSQVSRHAMRDLHKLDLYRRYQNEILMHFAQNAAKQKHFTQCLKNMQKRSRALKNEACGDTYSHFLVYSFGGSSHRERPIFLIYM